MINIYSSLTNISLKKMIIKNDTGSIIYYTFFFKINSLSFFKSLIDEQLWQWPLVTNYFLFEDFKKINKDIVYL